MRNGTHLAVEPTFTAYDCLHTADRHRNVIELDSHTQWHETNSSSGKKGERGVLKLPKRTGAKRRRKNGKSARRGLSLLTGPFRWTDSQKTVRHSRPLKPGEDMPSGHI